MIKFFRQIRLKSMENNKTSRYFKYAIGEIFLVVIGILIALQINNWNETQKKIDQSNIALKELLAEVSNTKRIIENTNKGNSQITNVIKTYLEGKISNPTDSLKNSVVKRSIAYNPLKLSIPILEREVSANKLIIEQKGLLKELQGFKNLHITANQTLFYLDNYWNSNVTNFLDEQKLMLNFVSLTGKLDIDSQGLVKLYDSDKFKNIIAMEFLHLDDYTQRIDKLHNQIEKIENKLSIIIKANIDND